MPMHLHTRLQVNKIAPSTNQMPSSFASVLLLKDEAQSDAVAEARSYASASTTASASTSTNVNVKVDADRINEFDAQVTAGASNFVVADANAAAEAFASAYAEALAKIKVSAKISEYHCCRHKSRHRNKVCRFKNKCKWHYDWKCSGQCGWWTTVFSEKFCLKSNPSPAKSSTLSPVPSLNPLLLLMSA